MRALVVASLLVAAAAGCSRTTIPGALEDSPAALPDVTGAVDAGPDEPPSRPPVGGTQGPPISQPMAGTPGTPPSDPNQECPPGAQSEPGMPGDPCAGGACLGGVLRAHCLPGGRWSECVCGALPAAEECAKDLIERFPDSDPAASECVCRHCDALLRECQSDDQCSIIFDCAIRVGCFGAECYQPDACMREIDEPGVNSLPVMKVQALGACIDGAGCPRDQLR